VLNAKAAQLAGDVKKAREYYQALMELTKNAEVERPELAEAKKYLVALK
jgi:outer membrane murein-binding lipoprotein Lpp